MIDDDDITHGDHEFSEQEDGPAPKRRKHVVTTSGNDEWLRQQKLARERMSPPQRIKNMEKAINGFRIMSAGEGLLRGGFPRLPAGVENLMQQMKNISDAMSKFHLTGDNLNVSGNFNDGFTVTRENPCQQEQVNQNPQ